jgi:hypothetical protein
MNVEIVTEAAQFPEKEYINWIFLAVYSCKGVSGHVDTDIHVHVRNIVLCSELVFDL